jgi:hypothetical protein
LTLDRDTKEDKPLIDKEGHFGGKTITFWGSIVLISNNIAGPAMVAFPLVFQLGTALA